MQSVPLSSMLFDSVLQFAMEDDLKTWREEWMVIKVGVAQSHCISHWRFADEVLLRFSSLNQLKKMMSDFKRSTSKTELQIHAEKANIFSNQKAKKQKTKRNTNREQQGRNSSSIGKEKYPV